MWAVVLGMSDFFFDNPDVAYYGIDPIPLPETQDFYYVCGVAEYIPFKNSTFSDLIVLSSLDHFLKLDTFFQEVCRVLKPDGRFHIIQSIHEITGLKSGVKMLTHVVKDQLESTATTVKNKEAPKHIVEFSKKSISKTLNQHFDIVAEEEYSPKWYSPIKLFMSMRPKTQG